MSLTDELIARFQEGQDRARKANELRYAQGLEIFDKIIKQYEPGGEFGRGIETQLGRAKTKTVAEQTQQLVSSGLFGTSVTAGLGKKFEEEVGAPTRMRAQDISFEKLAQARAGKAGFIERREDLGPDFSLVSQLASQVGQAPAEAPAGTPAGQTQRAATPTRTTSSPPSKAVHPSALMGGGSSGGGGGRRIKRADIGIKPLWGSALGAVGRSTSGRGSAGGGGADTGWDWKKGISGAYTGEGKKLTDTGWTYMGDQMWRRRKGSRGERPPQTALERQQATDPSFVGPPIASASPGSRMIADPEAFQKLAALISTSL